MPYDYYDFPSNAYTGPGSLQDYSVSAEAPTSVHGEDLPRRSGFAGAIDWLGQLARDVTPAMERAIDIGRMSRGQRPIYAEYDQYYGRGRYGGQRLGEVIEDVRKRTQDRWDRQDQRRSPEPAPSKEVPTPSAGEEGTESLLKSGDTLVDNLQAQIDALQAELNALTAGAEVGVSDVDLGPGSPIEVQPWGGQPLVDPTRVLSP